MLKILGRDNSINVRKVLWTCAELSLPFEREDWGRDHRSTQTPSYLALNPNALVPVLIDGDFVLWESNTICRYLAQQYGTGQLLPQDVRARARVEQWMDWQAGELNNSWRYAMMALMRHSPAHRDTAAIAHSVHEWNRHMQMLDAELQRSGPFVCGEAFTLADVVLGLSCVRWKASPMDKPELAAVEAYMSRLRERPACLQYGDNGMP